MGRARWWGSAVALALVALIFGPGAASAAPVVSFADNQPVVVDLSTAPTTVDVVVVNSTPAPATGTITVTVTVRGHAQPYLTVRQPSLPIGPGQHSFTLDVSPNAVASTGTLVLTGDDGSLDREQVTLVGALPASASHGGALTPGSFDAFTAEATSFVPSYFRPLPSALGWGLWLLGAAFASYLAFRSYLASRATNRVKAGLAGLAAVVGVICVVVLLGGWVGSLINGGREHRPVASSKYTLNPPAGGVVRGTLAGSNGDPADIVADHARLTLSGLSSAGTYTGTVQTQPRSAGGGVKVSVTVRDWWLYAALAIGVGVLLGYLLTSFGVRRRPMTKLTVDLATLKQTIAQRESAWQQAAAGQPWQASYSFLAAATTWLDAATAQAGSDAAAAAKAVAAVGALATELDGVRWRVDQLGRDMQSLHEMLTDVVGTEAADATPGWLASLFLPLDLAHQDPATTDLVTNRKKAVDVAEAFGATIPTVVAKLTVLGERILAIGDEHADKRQDFHDDYVTAARQLLAASDDKALAAVSTAIDAQSTAADKLAEASKKDVTGAPFGGAQPPRFLAPIQNVTATLGSWPPSGPPAAVPPVYDADDVVTFEVDITPADDDTSLFWLFSDGERSRAFPRPVGGGPHHLTIQHQFGTTTGTVSAQLMSAGGRILAEPSVQIATPSLATRARHTLDADDRTVAIVASIIAVGSGMVALYLKNPTWGSSGDYVTALLWGSGTAEGLKLLATTVSSRFPAPAGSPQGSSAQ